MELPDLVRESLGEEDVVAGLRLGDEDLVVFTTTRAVVYRGEGLLSDEAISTYPFDFERLQADRSRRKASFTMTYMDDERDFSVPKDRGDRVLERLVEGSLRVGGAIEPDEAVTGVYRFSELTLVVSEGRLLKHVGEHTWDGDFEAFDYEKLTKLDFEEGSVATQVVLVTAGGRTDRIKAPNEQAGAVRKAIQSAVFDYHGVDSLAALNRKIEPDEAVEEPNAGAGLGLDSGIDPLVSDAEDADEESAASAGAEASSIGSAGGSTDSSTGATAGADQGASPGASPGSAQGGSAGASSGAGDEGGEGIAALGTDVETGSADPDFQAVTDQLGELTAAVERQNELLHRQQQTVQKLIQELQQAR